jgi:hypothetical protein
MKGDRSLKKGLTSKCAVASIVLVKIRNDNFHYFASKFYHSLPRLNQNQGGSSGTQPEIKTPREIKKEKIFTPKNRVHDLLFSLWFLAFSSFFKTGVTKTYVSRTTLSGTSQHRKLTEIVENSWFPKVSMMRSRRKGSNAGGVWSLPRGPKHI